MENFASPCKWCLEMDNKPVEAVYLPLELSAPGSNKFVRVLGLLDTGSTDLAISASLAAELGLSSLSESFEIDTANSSTSAALSAVDVRFICRPSGETIVLQNMRVTVTEGLSEPLIGFSFLRLFSIHLLQGEPVVFEFNDNISRSS